MPRSRVRGRIAALSVVSVVFAAAALAAVASCGQIIGLDSIDRVATCLVNCVDAGDATKRDSSTDTGKPEGGKCTTECCSDEGCAGITGNPRCDPTGSCVPCLPEHDNCPSGTICILSTMSLTYSCVASGTVCNTVADCMVDAGPATDGGVPSIACCDNQCTDPQSDPSNCGGCGLACSTSNVATPNCTAGACTSTCKPGFADCDMNKQKNGCETLIAGTDTANCGACGAVCSNENIATPTCAAGLCTGECDKGFADCDMNKLKNGCETDTNTSPTNCGGCGVMCSAENIVSPVCSGGASDGGAPDGGIKDSGTGDAAACYGTCGGGRCNGVCAAGYAACNDGGNLQPHGCNTLVFGNDPANCGGCGELTPANQKCCSGVDTPTSVPCPDAG